MNLYGEDGLAQLIDNKFYIMESIRWSVTHGKPRYNLMEGVSEKDQAKFEAIRGRLINSLLSALGMARMVVETVGTDAVDDYLAYEKVRPWIKEKFPKVEKILISKGDAGTAWLRAELKDDLIPYLKGVDDLTGKHGGRSTSGSV